MSLRVLVELIAKCKTISGVPYNVFTMYDSFVWPVINYSAPIWGFRSYSCIDAVHNRAMRFFLGVGKYTPNDAVSGEMVWKPTSVRQWKSVFLYWSKNSRLNKRIALWASEKSSRSCKNWMCSVSQFLIANNFRHYANIAEAIPSSHRFVADLENILFENFVTTRLARINSTVCPSGRGRNTLRVYNSTTYPNECKSVLNFLHIVLIRIRIRIVYW